MTSPSRRAFAIQNVELGRLERRRHLVFTTHAGFVADDFVALLIEPMRRMSGAPGVELQRIAMVVSGLPNITIAVVAVSLRSAWLINRGLQAGRESPFRLQARPWA
jgi:hypothetical protein